MLTSSKIIIYSSYLISISADLNVIIGKLINYKLVIVKFLSKVNFA